MLTAGVLALGVSPAIAEGERLQREARLLPRGPVGVSYVLIADERAHHAAIPYQSVALHVHAYGTLGGGASAFTFPANPYLNPLRRPRADLLPAGNQWRRLRPGCTRDPACFDPPRYALELAALAVRFDSLLLPFAPQALIDELSAMGWHELSPHAFQVGKAGVALTLPAELPAGTLIVRAGHPASIGPIVSHKLSATPAAGRELSLSPLPAGSITLEAFLDRDGDGRPSAADLSLLPGMARELRLAPGEQLRITLPSPEPAETRAE
jgi:hypothetical protein